MTITVNKEVITAAPAGSTVQTEPTLTAGTINAANVVGKTIYAPNKRAVNVYRIPGGSVIYTVAKKQPVGVVYSWLSPSSFTDSLYWMFSDGKGGFYYIKHEDDLVLKGVDDGKDWIDKLLNPFNLEAGSFQATASKLVVGALLIYGGKSLIDVVQKNRYYKTIKRKLR